MSELKLRDFTQSEIERRINSASDMCGLKYYNCKQINVNVTEISYQISYNTLGHVIFGIFTLGVANIIAENSKIEKRYFETSSGMCLGYNQSDVEKYYNDKLNTCIDNFELIEAEELASKLYHFKRSNTNGSQYQFLQDVNNIQNNVDLGRFEKVKKIFYTIETRHKFMLPNKLLSFYRGFKTKVEKCCRYQVPEIDLNQNKDNFFSKLDTINIRYIEDIEQAILELKDMIQDETNQKLVSYLKQSIQNLQLSQNGIAQLKTGNFEKAKTEFDKIDGYFDEYKKYSHLCEISIEVTEILQNQTINTESSHLWKQLSKYMYLNGSAKFKFKNLLSICEILNDISSNKVNTSEYYLQLISVYKMAIETSTLQDITEILKKNLNQIIISNKKDVTKLHESLIKESLKNIQNDFQLATNLFNKSCILAKEYDLCIGEWKNFFDKYIKAHKYWKLGWESEKETDRNNAKENFQKAQAEISNCETNVFATSFIEDIERKIKGNSLINEGLESKSLIERYNLILGGYNQFVNANDVEVFQDSLKLTKTILDSLEAEINDNEDSFIHIEVSDGTNEEEYISDFMTSSNQRLL